MDELRDTQYNLPIGTDTISRCEAIDALRKMQTYKLFSGDDMLLIDQAGAMTELMLLPTAEPKIIRCKECINRHLGHGFCPMVHVSIDGQYELYELNQDNDFCSFAERRTE